MDSNFWENPFFDQENVCPDPEINDKLKELPENQLPENQLLELQTGLSFESWKHVIRLEEVNLIMKALLEDLHMPYKKNV